MISVVLRKLRLPRTDCYPGLFAGLKTRSGSPDVVQEEKALLSKIAREQARFSLEVRKDDQR